MVIGLIYIYIYILRNKMITINSHNNLNLSTDNNRNDGKSSFKSNPKCKGKDRNSGNAGVVSQNENIYLK